MTYDKNIPDFALQPAREPEEPDAFDPSPYDRLLNLHSRDQEAEVLTEEPGIIEEYKFFPFFDGEEEPSHDSSQPEGDSPKRSRDLKRILEAQEPGTKGESLTDDVWAQLEAQLTEELKMPMARPDPSHTVASAGEEETRQEIILEPVLAGAGPEEEVVEEVTAPVGDDQAQENPEVVPVMAGAEEEEPEAVEVIASPESEEEQVVETIAEPAEAWDLEEEPAEAWDLEEEPTEAALEPERNKPMESARPVAAAPVQGTAGDATLIVPTAGSLMTNELKMTDIREKPEIRVYIEEDILVPDTKEDLASILSMTGKASLSDPEIRVGQMSQDSVKVTGEIELHTLYIPENYTGEHHLINIQSRLPFKTEWPVAAEPLSRLVIQPSIESVDYTVINERKFRAKLTVRLAMREYANVEMQVFQGIKGEKLQLLKEKIQMTHVSERKTDVMEINETLALKDSQPHPERILKYDIDVVENHKQVTEDKAVVNATIYCNVLYLGSVSDPESEAEEGSNVTRLSPQLYQGKTEFTQFIPIANSAEGSKITFNYNGLSVHIKEPSEEEGSENAFSLEGRVETTIETYKNLEREIVTDIYHRTKDVVCDKVELEAMSLGGSGVTEAAVREIINVPEKYGEVKRVIYIYGTIQNSRSFLEQNKNILEGTIDITLLCLPEDENKAAFRLNKELNFRGSMEIPMGRGDTKANSDIAIKELWFDRINAKQIEVNANLFISSTVYGQNKYQVIQNVCFVETKEEEGVKPGMVVYITKNGDTLWNIAKKYRTTMEMITEINELPMEQNLPEGMKLLIVK